MHGVQIRDRRFKSTPTRRPYRLPLKKSQVNISESSPISMHEEHITNSTTEDVEIATGVTESLVSEMDSDERYNVPLARLLNKGLFSNVEPSIADVPITTAYSNESSSSEDIFVPTPGHSSVTNKEVGQSWRFLPFRSSIRFSSLIDDQYSVPDLDPVGDSIGNLGGNIVDPTNENPNANVDAHGELTDNCALNNVEPNVDVP
ncbi:uncharacterized protein E5676_scaffold986G00450 [Cucumis melo var. makuwa]|uniref:Envelope-like protein n=1 Tax=Cucumis melo var. makuwa TaxID=1194695 RepID=A0A5A7V3I5_CUCMM|nr:uncharacterized protein E6C27_scaffold357G00190 [Cucumis melo var. makuwa]TYJ96751.1 uncharacterized protein E5676_scaffold986G00450 [Cucumis melo var. makuwa]